MLYGWRSRFLDREIIIIGAGVAGLSCAKRLQRAGITSLVIDQARGVGGRCATRRVEDQPIDHGVSFLHGADPEFLAAIEGVGGGMPLKGWPRRITGTGAPCQPEAFQPYERRLAFREGLSVFPKDMARNLEVRLETRIASLALLKGRAHLQSDNRASFTARTLVVCLPVEQTRELLRPLQEISPDVGGVLALLDMISSEPCLTLLGGYPLQAPAPSWDVLYPEDSSSLLLVSHDSTKRSSRRFHVLVYQCRARWSRQRLEHDPAAWSQEILDEAERLCGSWASQPLWTQPHRWRYARVEQASALSSPLLLSLPEGGRVGLAGEAFAPGVGVEGAWLSGRRLAQRILEEVKE